MTSLQDLKNKSAKLPPIDTEVQLPAAIRAAAARSNSLHAQAYSQPEPTTDVQQPTATPAATGTEGQPAQAQPEAVATPAPGAEDTPTPPKAIDWENRYNSMKGRYDRAEDTIRGLVQRINALEAAPPAPQHVQQPTPDLQFKPSITDKDRDEFGADFIDVAQRAAMDKVHPEIASLKAQLARLEGTVGNVASQTAQQTQQTIFQTLDGKLANWRKINRDAKFLAWVALPDPLSGVIRKNMMMDAFNQGDAQRVLRFFNGFLSEEAATAPATPDPVTPQGNSKVPLETFAAPGRATTAAATTAPAEKETISRRQIANFYALVNKGHYRGNEAEKDRLERMIFAAEAEGRITD